MKSVLELKKQPKSPEKHQLSLSRIIDIYIIYICY